MNNVFKKVLSAAEEFVTRPSSLGLVADAILDRIVPKGTAYAACTQYRWREYAGCGSCTGLCNGWIAHIMEKQSRNCIGSGCGSICGFWLHVTYSCSCCPISG